MADELIDSEQIAVMMGFKNARGVRNLKIRNPDFPRHKQIVSAKKGRKMLYSQNEIVNWFERRQLRADEPEVKLQTVVDDKNLITTEQVADMLGFNRIQSVHYRLISRPDFPRPVGKRVFGKTRTPLYDRAAIEQWQRDEIKADRAITRTRPGGTNQIDRFNALAVEFISRPRETAL